MIAGIQLLVIEEIITDGFHCLVHVRCDLLYLHNINIYILKKTALHNQIKHTITQVTTHITFPHTKVSNYMHTKVGETRI